MSKCLTLSLALSAPLAFCASAALPDLVIDRPLLARSVEVQPATFGAGDCAVVEGCSARGTRRLLRFAVGFKNIGKAALVIGDPHNRPELFEASPCHGHFHLKGAAAYELLNSSGQTLLRARKQAFCFRDSVAFSASAGPARFTCEFQGISAGWEDIYDQSLDCQWLDITSLPGGTYLLQVTVNPDGVFTEGNYGNNTASVSITLASKAREQPPGDGATTPKVKKPENGWKKLADKFKKNKDKKKKKKHKHKHKGKGKGHGHHHGENHDDDHDDHDDDDDRRGRDDDDK